MKRIYAYLSAVLIGLFLWSSASAAIVTQSFAGISDKGDYWFPGITKGDRVNVSMRYETEILDTDARQYIGRYHGALYSIEIGLPDTGDYWTIEPTDDSSKNSIVVLNDGAMYVSQPGWLDEYIWVLDGRLIGPSINGNQPYLVQVMFFEVQGDSMPTMLTDDSIPLSLGPYRSRSVSFYTAIDDSHSVIDSIVFVPVPIPGAVWLLGSALLGITGIRRFHSRQ